MKLDNYQPVLRHGKMCKKLCGSHDMWWYTLSNTKEKTDLSVVILTKNEETMIRDCIESVISAIKFAIKKGTIETSEIILVDSASTDNTVEIAKKNPIKILQLDSSWPLSCGAGAHIGLLNARGRKICIVDGDIVLNKTWFVCADKYIEMENVGCLRGITREYMSGDNKLHQNLIEYGNPIVLKNHFTDKDSLSSDLYKEIKTATENRSQGYSAGTLYLKTEIAKKAGGYNPFLIAAEDTEMERQIVESGYKFLSIPCLMGTHYMAEKTGKITQLQYLKTMFRNSKGIGQAARYNFKNKKKIGFYFKYCFINKHFLKMDSIISILFLLVVLNGILVLHHNFIYALIFDFFAFIILVVRQAKKKQNLGLFLYNLINNILFVLVRQFGFVRGFLKTPKDPRNYPKNPKVIK